MFLSLRRVISVATFDSRFVYNNDKWFKYHIIFPVGNAKIRFFSNLAPRWRFRRHFFFDGLGNWFFSYAPDEKK